MTLFWDYTLNGIANGMIYAAMALALVLIYRATRIVNFAQGAAGMLTTFIAFSLLSRGLGYWWAFVLVLVIGFAIGAATQLVLIRPLQGKSDLNPVIVTIGLLVVFEGLAGAIYGNSSRGFPAAFSQRGLRIGHTTIAFSHFDVFILVAVLLLMTGTLILFRFTSLGLRMRATAFSREIPLNCSICEFQLSTRSSRSAASMPTLIDSTMFSLNSLSRSYSSTLSCSERYSVAFSIAIAT